MGEAEAKNNGGSQMFYAGFGRIFNIIVSYQNHFLLLNEVKFDNGYIQDL